MKKLFFSFCAVSMLAVVGCQNASENTATTTDTTAAPAEAAAAPAPPMDSAAMMKAWMDYATPGDMHKMMASWNGTWKAEVTSYWNGPDKPEQSTATCENKMILNGLYQHTSYKGTMSGMPFEGMGTMGYDNSKKKFVNTWIDNMGSGIMQTEGTYDEATKTLTLASAKQADPITGKECEMREVHKIVDDKTQTMEMYQTTDGQPEMKVMEMKLTKM